MASRVLTPPRQARSARWTVAPRSTQMGAARDLEHGSDPARCALPEPDEEAPQTLVEEVEAAVVVVAVTVAVVVVQTAPPIALTTPWPNPCR